MSTAYKLQSSFLPSQNKLWNNIEERGKVGQYFTMSKSSKLVTPYSLTCRSTTNNCSTGKFGRFGGKYMPELLISCLTDLEDEPLMIPCFRLVSSSKEGRARNGSKGVCRVRNTLILCGEVDGTLQNKDGCGPQIYIKREDLSHGGAHKINNALAQAMLAKRLGRTTIVTATGAGRHGVAIAAVCAKLGLSCTVLMGSLDIKRQPSNVGLMKLLGAQVKLVDGNYKNASSEAVREWVANLETSYHLLGSVVGPHPCPTMVREFQSVIGKEVGKQAMEKWGGSPDVLVACVGGGSNAMGLFHEFIEDKGVRLVAVEAAGNGLETGCHSATLSKGEVGVYHGTMSYLLQDDEGQIVGPYSIGVGLECPGVGPELSYLKENGRAEFHAVTDEEALQAYKRLCRLEGISPALEASHALAFLEKLCPTLPQGTKVVVNCSGRGDKDAATVQQLDELFAIKQLSLN